MRKKQNQSQTSNNDFREHFKFFELKIIELILSHKLQPSMEYDKEVLSKVLHYSSYFLGTVKDNRFEIISVDRMKLDVFKPSLIFEFHKMGFILYTGDYEAKFEFSYENLLEVQSIIQSLENGQLSKELYCLIQKTGIFTCSDGIFPVEIKDFRFDPPKISRSIIKIGNETLQYYINSEVPSLGRRNINLKTEIERQLLLIKTPKICTDPSPNVTRLLSMRDFRKKGLQKKNSLDTNIMDYIIEEDELDENDGEEAKADNELVVNVIKHTKEDNELSTNGIKEVNELDENTFSNKEEKIMKNENNNKGINAQNDFTISESIKNLFRQYQMFGNI